MTYRVETMFGDYDVEVRKVKYYDGNLGIDLFEPGEGPFARLTTNLCQKLPENQAHLDTNNCPWAEEFVQENKLGKPVGKFGFSGYCVYPLYEFDMGVIV